MISTMCYKDFQRKIRHGRTNFFLVLVKVLHRSRNVNFQKVRRTYAKTEVTW